MEKVKRQAYDMNGVELCKRDHVKYPDEAEVWHIRRILDDNFILCHPVGTTFYSSFQARHVVKYTFE